MTADGSPGPGRDAAAGAPPGRRACAVTSAPTSATTWRPAPPGVHQGVASGPPDVPALPGRHGRDAGQRRSTPPPGTFVALVGGLHDGPAEIAMGDRQTGLQLRLTWRGARALLGVPAGELAGDTVDLAALLGRRTGALLDRLAARPGWARAVRPAGRRAGRRWPWTAGPSDGVRPEVGYAWDRLTADRRQPAHRRAGRRGRLEPPAPGQPVPGRDRADPESRRPGDPLRAGLRPAARAGPPGPGRGGRRRRLRRPGPPGPRLPGPGRDHGHRVAARVPSCPGTGSPSRDSRASAASRSCI